MRLVKIKREDGGRRRFPILFAAGPFVIHRSWSRAAWSYPLTVTHVPSGMACFKWSSFAGAKRVARALAALPIAWDRIRSKRDLSADEIAMAETTRKRALGGMA